MKIEKNLDGNTLTVLVSERLDTTTAPKLDAELKSIPTNITLLILDFEHLDYISSAGLRVLLSTHKMMSKRGNLVIRHVNETIAEIFDITGFCDILTIE